MAKDRSPNVSTNNIAPPLPPHRSVPAPPPPTRGSSIVCIPPNNSDSYFPIAFSNGFHFNGLPFNYRHQTVAITMLHHQCHSVIHRCEIAMVHWQRIWFSISRQLPHRRWYRREVPQLVAVHDLLSIWMQSLAIHFIMLRNFLHHRHLHDLKNRILVEI